MRLQPDPAAHRHRPEVLFVGKSSSVAEQFFRRAVGHGMAFHGGLPQEEARKRVEKSLFRHLPKGLVSLGVLTTSKGYTQ